MLKVFRLFLVVGVFLGLAVYALAGGPGPHHGGYPHHEAYYHGYHGYHGPSYRAYAPPVYRPRVVYPAPYVVAPPVYVPPVVYREGYYAPPGGSVYLQGRNFSFGIGF